MKKQSHKQYTIGKQLRNAKGLRKCDPKAEIIQPTQQLSQYIMYLKQKGVTIKDLSVARFYTKNGLPYIGLITDNLFPTNKIFIRVPVNCLLNTRIAFHGGIKQIFQDHPQYFAKQFHNNWQDHILLAYILYEYGRGKDSDWYHLIRNLPRQIDYVIFWDQKQISLLQDKVLQKMIIKAKTVYQKQAQQFMKIAQKYPQHFSKQILIWDNIRWIHTHLVTRCFGKYFQYTTMVPFAELINHECSDVYYSMFYNQGNPHDTKQIFYEQKQLTQQQIDDLHTSDGSYDSQEFDDLEDLFQKQNFDPITQKHQQQNAADVIKLAREAFSLLFNSINFGDNISLGFLCEMYEGIDQILRSKETPSLKKMQLTRQFSSVSYYVSRIRNIQSICKLTKTYYNGTVFSQKQNKTQEESNIVSLPQKGVSYYPDEWQLDKFDQFLMLCSSKDQFQKHSQIFFCYGRLSNRMMLMRYGMTLEHNKYNHIYLHLPIQQYTSNYIIFPKILRKYGMSKTKIIKVRRTKLCVELLLFLRCLQWKFKQKIDQIFKPSNYQSQLIVIKKAIQIYKQQLSHFSCSKEQNQKSLFDNKIGYHEYFSVIYKLQKQRIIQQQIRLLNIAYQIVSRLLDGKTTLQYAMLIVPELQTPFEMRTHRLMMRDYFDKLFKQ